MSKHTQGMWEAIPQTNTSSVMVGVLKGTQMQPFRMRVIANVLARLDSLDEDRANARLIAAAPRLLEALKKIETALKSQQSLGYFTTDYWQDHLIMLRIAIAEAEGEQE